MCKLVRRKRKEIVTWSAYILGGLSDVVRLNIIRHDLNVLLLFKDQLLGWSIIGYDIQIFYDYQYQGFFYLIALMQHPHISLKVLSRTPSDWSQVIAYQH